MSANERQVGGTHYGDSDFKHWDWVPTIGMQYHEGCATKHLQRYDKKGEAVEDLEKCIHYLEKTIEQAPLILSRIQFVRPTPDFIFESTARFCDLNQVVGEARRVMFSLSRWTTTTQLTDAIRLVNGLLTSERRRPAPIPPAKPVPLSDSNKHADRSTPL